MDLMKRFYDPTIGRFMQVDPVTNTQENYSTYQYGWNNPILRSDPNGDCPNCIVGFAIGAAVDYGFQIAGNLANGQGLKESLTNFESKSILISGLAGAATSGLSAIGGIGAQFAISTSIDVAESVSKQVSGSGLQSVTLTQTASDVIANKVAGALTKKLENVIDTKTLIREVDRTQRVSSNDPASRGRAKKAEIAANRLVRTVNINKSIGQTSSGVVGNAIQNTSNVAMDANGAIISSPAVKFNAVSSDATRTERPYLPIQRPR